MEEVIAGDVDDVDDESRIGVIGLAIVAVTIAKPAGDKVVVEEDDELPVAVDELDSFKFFDFVSKGNSANKNHVCI